MAKEEPQEPDLGEYTDYLILSSSDFTQGWRHNIMRLAPGSSSDTTDVRHWTEARLNRRDMQRVRREEYAIARKAADTARAEEEAAAARERGEAVNGADGTQVELKPGMPGYMAAQVKKEEEQRDESKVAPAVGAAAGAKRPKRGFGAPKKTRRIFVTEGSSRERRLRFEERHPWILETEDDKKPPNETRWVGKMDSSTSAAAGEGSSYICLVLDPHSAGSEAAFKVVPANRWYKFASRPKYNMLTADEAEAEFEKMQKASDLDMWFSSRRTNTGALAASTSGNNGRGPGSRAGFSLGTHNQASGVRERLAQARGTETSQSQASRLRTVYGSRRAEDDLFDGEAAGVSGRRAGKAAIRPRRKDDDEREDFEFEEDFQDDEEGIGQVGDDALDAEENRQLEERIKREMRDINAFGPGQEVDEVDEDELEKQLTKTGRRMKKLLKKRGRRGRPEEDEDDDVDDEDDDDDDDDLKNPYASEDDEESDSEDERRRKQQKEGTNSMFSATQPPPMSRNGSVHSSGPKYPGASSASSTGPSRSASVGPPGSRAASPVPNPANAVKRAASPTESRPGSRAASPTPPPSAAKRKAEEGHSPTDSEKASGATGTTKRRKPGSPSPAPTTARVAPADESALIAREEIVAFIRNHTPTTKELLKHFKASMARDPRNRDVILQVTKEVAAIANGKLGLKPGVVA